MRKIPITKGYVAIVDDDDFEMINIHKWNAELSKRKDGTILTVYAKRWGGTVDGKERKIFMHRVICNVANHLFVDHIDGNGLNNSKANLRICTASQNQRNKFPSKNGKTSIFKGVYWHIQSKRWVSRIKASGVSIYLGCYRDEIEAALAYNNAAKLLHGEFARLNTVA